MGNFEIQLRSWEEHKQSRNKFYDKRYVSSGIACPQCGAELLVDKMVVIATYPPQRKYYCEKCKWHGTA